MSEDENEDYELHYVVESGDLYELLKGYIDFAKMDIPASSIIGRTCRRIGNSSILRDWTSSIAQEIYFAEIILNELEQRNFLSALEIKYNRTQINKLRNKLKKLVFRKSFYGRTTIEAQ